MFGILSGFLSGIGKYVLIGVVALGVIGGFWWFMSDRIDDLQERLAEKNEIIEKRNEKIASLKMDVQNLEAQNSSLQQQVQTQRKEIQNYIETVTRLREKDRRLENQIQRLREKLNSEQRDERIQKIMQSDQASLLLRLTNKDAQCELIHFGEDGECVRGVWKPDGSENDSENGENSTENTE